MVIKLGVLKDPVTYVCGTLIAAVVIIAGLVFYWTGEDNSKLHSAQIVWGNYPLMQRHEFCEMGASGATSIILQDHLVDEEYLRFVIVEECEELREDESRN